MTSPFILTIPKIKKLVATVQNIVSPSDLAPEFGAPLIMTRFRERGVDMQKDTMIVLEKLTKTQWYWEQDRQCAYNVTSRRFHATIVEVEKQ